MKIENYTNGKINNPFKNKKLRINIQEYAEEFQTHKLNQSKFYP